VNFSGERERDIFRKKDLLYLIKRLGGKKQLRNETGPAAWKKRRKSGLGKNKVHLQKRLGQKEDMCKIRRFFEKWRPKMKKGNPRGKDHGRKRILTLQRGKARKRGKDLKRSMEEKTLPGEGKGG